MNGVHRGQGRLRPVSQGRPGRAGWAAQAQEKQRNPLNCLCFASFRGQDGAETKTRSEAALEAAGWPAGPRLRKTEEALKTKNEK